MLAEPTKGPGVRYEPPLANWKSRVQEPSRVDREPSIPGARESISQGERAPLYARADGVTSLESQGLLGRRGKSVCLAWKALKTLF